MATDITVIVTKMVEDLRKAGAPPTEQDLNRLAAQISGAFKAKQGEVAMLRVSADGKMLHFIFPVRLSGVGSIPISTAHSLAAKTAREGRGEIVNDFSVYRHPTVFEAIKLSEEDKATPIQKIVSSPMLVSGKVTGVIQISRKGQAGERVGPDFTPEDLDKLGKLGTILGKYFAEFPAPSLGGPKSPSPA